MEDIQLYTLQSGLLDAKQGHLYRAGSIIKLTANELVILQALLTVSGDVATRKHLLMTLGYTAHSKTRTLDTTVRRLRGKLELDDTHPVHIQTIRGIGYRWSLEAKASEPDPESTNLTEHSVTLEGRTADLKTLCLTLGSVSRLVTIKGSVGIGKSAIAHTYALAMAGGYAPLGGVWHCDLTQARTTDDLIQVIGNTLRITNHNLTEAKLLEHLALRGPMLLVLDNFEHLVWESAVVLPHWLDAVQSMHLLVTSQEVLGCEQERVISLGGVDENAGLRILEASAGRRLPDEAKRLAIRLEGIPLVLSLVGARLATIEPIELLPQINASLCTTEYTTHLDAVLVGTWSQLSLPERTALTRLTVFRGGFTRDAAISVAGSTLNLFVEKSLIEDRGGRFEFLNFIHNFAVRQCSPEIVDDAIQAHLRWCSAFVQRVGIFDFKTLHSEFANIRAAIERAGLSASGVRLLVAVSDYIVDHQSATAHFQELYRVCERPLPDELLVKVQLKLIRTAHIVGELDEADRWLKVIRTTSPAVLTPQIKIQIQVLSLVQNMSRHRFDEVVCNAPSVITQARRLSRYADAADACGQLGGAYRRLGRLDEANTVLEQGLYFARRVGAFRITVMLIRRLANLAQNTYDFERAWQLRTEEEAAARAMDSPHRTGAALLSTAYLYLFQAEFELARKAADQAWRQLSHSSGITLMLTDVSACRVRIEVTACRPASAELELRQLRTLAEHVKHPIFYVYIIHLEGQILGLKTQYQKALERYDCALARATADKIEITLSFIQFDRAATLHILERWPDAQAAYIDTIATAGPRIIMSTVYSHLGLSALHAQLGAMNTANEHLSCAESYDTIALPALATCIERMKRTLNGEPLPTITDGLEWGTYLLEKIRLRLEESLFVHTEENRLQVELH